MSPHELISFQLSILAWSLRINQSAGRFLKHSSTSKIIPHVVVYSASLNPIKPSTIHQHQSYRPSQTSKMVFFIHLSLTNHLVAVLTSWSSLGFSGTTPGSTTCCRGRTTKVRSCAAADGWLLPTFWGITGDVWWITAVIHRENWGSQWFLGDNERCMLLYGASIWIITNGHKKGCLFAFPNCQNGHGRWTARGTRCQACSLLSSPRHPMKLAMLWEPKLRQPSLWWSSKLFAQIRHCMWISVWKTSSMKSCMVDNFQQGRDGCFIDFY